MTVGKAKPAGSWRTCRGLAILLARPVARGPVILIAVCLAVGSSVSGCSFAGDEGPGPRKQSLSLTPHQEWSLGEQAYQEVLGKSKVVRTGPDVERVREIGRRIAKVAEIEPLQREINLRVKGYRFDWDYNLLQSDQVN